MMRVKSISRTSLFMRPAEAVASGEKLAGGVTSACPLFSSASPIANEKKKGNAMQ